MRPHVILVVLVLTSALTFVAQVHGIAPYSLSTNPSTTSLGNSVTITVTVTNGARNTFYGLTIGVQKPNGTGSAITSQVISTDNSGSGSLSVQYPSSTSWTALSGTVATNLAGVYNVAVNQTLPTNIGTVATGQFTVISQMSVVVSQPTSGTIVQRGQTLTITVSVANSPGAVSGATVTAHTPSNGQLILPEVSSTNGVYSIPYQVMMNDPLGLWTIIVQAKDTNGNCGTSLPVNVTIAKSDLVVDSVLTYDSRRPSTSFSAGDSIYTFLRIRYPSGSYLTSGQYSVGLKNASGALVANSTGAYDGSLLGFYTSTGYQVSTLDPGGSWSIKIGANTLNDGYANTGPSTTITYSFWVNVIPPSWPVGSVLTVSSLTSSSLVLSWVSATSNAGVASYRIFENGVLIATVSGNVTSISVTGLASGSSYEFKVAAVDQASNVSSSDLSQMQTVPLQQSTSQLWLFVVSGIAGCLATVFAMRWYKPSLNSVKPSYSSLIRVLSRRR